MINPDELLVTGVFVEIVNREHDWKEQHQYVERHAQSILRRAPMRPYQTSQLASPT